MDKRRKPWKTKTLKKSEIRLRRRKQVTHKGKQGKETKEMEDGNEPEPIKK